MCLGRLFSDCFLHEGIQGTEAYQRLLADPGSINELRAQLVEAFDRFPVTIRPDEAQTEGQITKLKLVKRQMYGRGKLDLLQAGVIDAA